MRVFVAGATGTLGLSLVRALVSRGDEVVGLTRSVEKGRVLEQAGAGAAVADALDAVSLEQAVRAAKPDCVFHLLAAVLRPALAPAPADAVRGGGGVRHTPRCQQPKGEGRVGLAPAIPELP